MQAEKAAQRRLVGKAGAPRHGLYVEPRVPEQGLDLDNDVVGNHLMGGLAVYLLNDFGQVYGRYAQFIGIKSDLPARLWCSPTSMANRMAIFSLLVFTKGRFLALVVCWKRT